jgi:hypothetical protein
VPYAAGPFGVQKLKSRAPSGSNLSSSRKPTRRLPVKIWDSAGVPGQAGQPPHSRAPEDASGAPRCAFFLLPLIYPATSVQAMPRLRRPACSFSDPDKTFDKEIFQKGSRTPKRGSPFARIGWGVGLGLFSHPRPFCFSPPHIPCDIGAGDATPPPPRTQLFGSRQIFFFFFAGSYETCSRYKCCSYFGRLCP